MNALDSTGGHRLKAIGLATVMLLAAVAMAPVGLGAAGDGPAENLTLGPDPADANAESTHTWAFDDVDFDGEVDEITVEYPDGTSLDGLTSDDVTVTLTRTLASGPDTSDISVNNDEYAGNEATFDLSGVATTDIAGPGSVVIAGVANPAEGEYEPSITFAGDDDVVTVTADLLVNDGDDGDDGENGESPTDESPLSVEPADANADSTHTWSFDDETVALDGEVDTITATYPDGTSFTGLTNDDVTVEFTRTLASGPDTSEISVNNDEYDGGEAIFDLSGVATTDIAGESSVAIGGITNPGDGEYTPTLTFTAEDGETATLGGELVIGDGDADTLVAAVTDADGDSLADTDVLVTLDGTGSTAGETVAELATTDADGTVTVTVPAAGTYEVRITAPNAGEATETVTIDGETAEIFALETASAGSVDALVTDADGEPIAEGAWVQIDGDDLAAPLTGQTDADGVVLIEGVAPGEYELTATTAAAGTTESVPVSVVAGETTATELFYGDASTTATLSAVVVAPDGDPLAEETVAVAYDGPETGAAVVETDADGAFELSRLKTGTYEVTATAEGLPTSDPVAVDIAAGETATLQLAEAAPEPGTVSGTVTDADGDPIDEGTWVSFGADDDGFGPDKTVQLGPDGAFEFDGVAPGSYDVVAETSDAGETDEHKVNVAAGQSTDGVTITYAEDDSPGNGPPSGTPGEGPGGGGGGNGPPGNGNGPPGNGNGPPGNGNGGPPSIVPVL